MRFIAELSANASASLDEALQLVREASKAGATDVKVQVWTPGTMALQGAYTIPSGPWAGRDLADLYRETALPWEWIRPVRELARSCGMYFGSSVFDRGAVDMLQAIGADFLKIASFEITDTPLIAYAASTGLPMILSTGMATRPEILEAVASARGAGNLALLACSSSYPCDINNANVRRITALRAQYPGLVIGYSDHTTGPTAAAIAVGLGAGIIEKHICLPGQRTADADFSSTPDRWAATVDMCKQALAALGSDALGPLPGEMVELRRGLHWVRDLPPGHRITETDMVSARPASQARISIGIQAVGATLAVAVKRGQPVDFVRQLYAD